MALIILHDLDDEAVLVNPDCLNAAIRKYPDSNSMIKEPYTKLYYVSRDKGVDAAGFPDSVKETPADIAKLANGAKAAK